MTVIATPAVSQVAEKSFFGKLHVRIGTLFANIFANELLSTKSYAKVLPGTKRG